MGIKNSSGLQIKVAYWPALAVGGTAQLATTHYPNDQTLDPQSAAQQTYPSHTMAFTPQCSPATTHYFSSECYQIQITTQLPSPRDGRLSLPETKTNSGHEFCPKTHSIIGFSVSWVCHFSAYRSHTTMVVWLRGNTLVFSLKWVSA